ncbi:MAG: hypothetical protein BWY78_00475 [Alphaproteobacteria bacterium ADurb.Bin438]|nr:MAG: hypothetical protein BWY78_00475 [Alphaproteobacteria bacterium ADurb.Bin438]
MFSYKRKYCLSFLLYFLISVSIFYSFDVKAQALPRPISIPALENQRLEDLRNQKRDEKIKEISKEYQEKKEQEKPLPLDDESKDVSDKDNVVIMYVYFINFDPSKVFSKTYFQNIKDRYEEKILH